MAWLTSVRREGRFVRELVRTALALHELRPGSPTTFADLVEAQAARRPEQVAIAFEDVRVSYAELDRAANRVARWARAAGIARGDTVALSMENRPEFLITWLGLAKLGAVIALQNTNLRADALAHCVREVSAKHWVIGAELAEAAASALPALERPPELPGARALDPALAQHTGAALDSHARRGMSANDPLFFIYTSGTTGLPKAARVSHFRALSTALGGARATQLLPRDTLYVALPLYHSAGGTMAAGAALLSGATIALARRFSASRFWSDCVRYDVTVFQYIGELCRFLVNAPEHPDEKRHRIRACVGNGLRPEIWDAFQKRFEIPRIVEFYGATEGNVALMNLDGKVGSVGRLPRFLQRLVGVELVRFDPEREAPLRGEDGFCQRCEPGEAGELLGRLGDTLRYEGYSDAAATEKKILRDVFERGDAYFRTGDLLRFDEEGYFYFVDRIGDTFRWKGENVATTEVAQALAGVAGVREVNVYGVEVPGHEGRAGMAALVVDGDFDPAALHAHVHAALPSYARPLFLRLAKSLDHTGTFKLRKLELAREGFDPSQVSDPLLFDDVRAGRYVPLGSKLAEALRADPRRL